VFTKTIGYSKKTKRGVNKWAVNYRLEEEDGGIFSEKHLGMAF